LIGKVGKPGGGRNVRVSQSTNSLRGSASQTKTPGRGAGEWEKGACVNKDPKEGESEKRRGKKGLKEGKKGWPAAL